MVGLLIALIVAGASLCLANLMQLDDTTKFITKVSLVGVAASIALRILAPMAGID